MSDENDFPNRCNQVLDEAADRYGREHVEHGVAAIVRAHGQVDPAKFMEVLSRPDAADVIFDAGQQSMLKLMEQGCPDAERHYQAYRDSTRNAHRARNGR
jgi:riboflavin biosynthesis pyrimidine reductase